LGDLCKKEKKASADKRKENPLTRDKILGKIEKKLTFVLLLCLKLD
jgi:hypothetical protein